MIKRQLIKRIFYQQKSETIMSSSGILDLVTNFLKDSKNSTKESTQLYECLILKTFQSIQSFIDKLNALFLRTDDIESNYQVMFKKVEMLETLNQNINFQFRTTHLQMDKKMTNILSQFNNMEEQMRIIRFDLPSENYLNSENFLAKSRGFKSREKIKSRSNIKKISQSSVSNRGRSSTKSIHSRIDQNSVKELEPSSPKIIQKASMKAESFSLKPSTSFEEENKQIIGQTMSIQIQNYMTSKMELMSQRLEERIDEIVQNNTINFKEEFKEEYTIKSQHQIDSMTQKIIDLKMQLSRQANNINENLKIISEKFENNVKEINLKLANKVEDNFFLQSFNNFSDAVCLELQDHKKKFGKKEQIMKALSLLEKKINNMILEEEEEDFPHKNSKPCSSASILPKMANSNSNGFFPEEVIQDEVYLRVFKEKLRVKTPIAFEGDKNQNDYQQRKTVDIFQRKKQPEKENFFRASSHRKPESDIQAWLQQKRKEGKDESTMKSRYKSNEKMIKSWKDKASNILIKTRDRKRKVVFK